MSEPGTINAFIDSIDLDLNLNIDGQLRPMAEAANALYTLAARVAEYRCIPCPVHHDSCDGKSVYYPQCVERIMGWAFDEARQRKAAEVNGESGDDA